jgi:hypothetical protein
MRVPRDSTPLAAPLVSAEPALLSRPAHVTDDVTTHGRLVARAAHPSNRAIPPLLPPPRRHAAVNRVAASES